MSRFADIAIFVSMLFSLAAHAGAHYSKGGLGLRGALLCVGVPVISAVMLLLFGLFGYLSYVENFRNGPILAALPIWVRRARRA